MYNQDPTTKQVEILTKMIGEGATAYGIRKAMKISQTQTDRWLRQAQLTPKPPSRNVARQLDAREQAEFRTYYKTMPSQKDIFKKYGIGVKTLRSWLAQMDLEATPAQARPQTTRRPAADHSWQQERALASRLQGDDEPKVSIADKFRLQGLATANPYR
jgi:transposase